MVSLTVYSVVIFSRRYIDNDCINFKTFVFLAVYWSIWTSSYNTDIKVQNFKNGASTMLNNVFNLVPLHFTLLAPIRDIFNLVVFVPYLLRIVLLRVAKGTSSAVLYYILNRTCLKESWRHNGYNFAKIFNLPKSTRALSLDMVVLVTEKKWRLFIYFVKKALNVLFI